MDKMINLFDEYVSKAIKLTENILSTDSRDSDSFYLFSENRERLIHVIQSISTMIDWDEIKTETKTQLNEKIEVLKDLDTQLILKLEKSKEELRKEIESTHKSRKNVSSYNLSSTK